MPANGLFLAAFAVAFLLLLHFSVATSRLSEETKILAQEVARLDGELRATRRGNGDGAAENGSAAARRSASRPEQRRTSASRPASTRPQ